MSVIGDIEIGTIVRFHREGQPLSYFEGKIKGVSGIGLCIESEYCREPSFLIEYKNKNNGLVLEHIKSSNVLKIVGSDHET